MSESKVVISGDQRDALYRELLAHLNGIDDLRLAVEDEKDFERADRLAREYMDDLNLILSGIGWGDHGPETVELSTPPEDLRRVLTRLRDDAGERYEEERAEQEVFRSNWDRTKLVRDTCDEVLGRLPG